MTDKEKDKCLAVFLLHSGDKLIAEINPFLIEKEGAGIETYKPVVMSKVTGVVPMEGEVAGVVRPGPFIHPVVEPIPVEVFKLQSYIGMGLIQDENHPLYQQYREIWIQHAQVEESTKIANKKSRLITATR